MTWASPINAMPRTGPRVVCALCVTIETLAPTSALASVDLPLFGAPIRATNPQRVASSASEGSAIRRRLPDPFAQQHGESGRLLGGALVRSLPALRRNAVDLHLGGEARGMIGAFASDLEITGQRQAPSLRPFLQQGLGVGRGKLERVELRVPKTAHHGTRGLVPAVGKDRAEHRLASIGKDGLLAAASAAGLPSTHENEGVECPCLCDLRAGLGAHEVIEPARKLAFARLGKRVGEK